MYGFLCICYLWYTLFPSIFKFPNNVIIVRKELQRKINSVASRDGCQKIVKDVVIEKSKGITKHAQIGIFFFARFDCEPQSIVFF